MAVPFQKMAKMSDKDMETMGLPKNAPPFHADCWSGFKSVDPTYHSVAEPPTCPEDCAHCSEQFLPKIGKFFAPVVSVELHTDEQAQAEIDDLICTINTNLTCVRELLEKYGDAMANRWKKRTPSDRKALLLRAKPNLYPRKHVDADITFGLQKARMRAASDGRLPAGMSMFKSQDASLTPYLDILTLSEEPLKLLALLHYRAETSPSEWIVFDCRQMRTSFHIGRSDIAYNPHCVIALERDFGKLVQWDKNAAHKWDMIGYAAARLALIAQRSLTDLLRRMAELLIEGDLSHAAKGRIAWNKLAEQRFKEVDCEGTVWTYAESAFSAPPNFDINHIVEMFTTQRNAAEDDLWLLQTDPHYLRQLVDRFYTSNLHRGIQYAAKGQLLDFIILGNVRRVSDWDMLLLEAHRISKLSVELADQIGPGKVLPREYEVRLGLLDMCLKRVFDSQVHTMMLLCAALPSFRHHLKFDSNRPNNFNIATAPRDLFSTDPLFWNIVELKLHADELSRAPSYHLANIDEIISKSSPKEKKRIDQVFLDHLSGMAAVAEALSGIAYHRSRTPMEFGDFACPEDSKVGFLDFGSAGLIEQLVSANPKGSEKAWAKLEELRRLPKPSAGLTRQNISRTSALHAALQEYWRELRKAKEHLLRSQPIIIEVFADSYLQSISIGLTKEHKARVREEEESLRRAVEEKENEQKSLRSRCGNKPSLNGHSIGNETQRSAAQPVSKTKVKTRPQEQLAVQIEQLAVNDTPTATSTDIPRIEVSKNSIGVFQQMFSKLPIGMVKWNELVAALRDAGFSATSHGGSGVNFKDYTASKGTIVIHRPHPDSSIDPEKLRGIGKRLTKWFEWNEDTFVVRTK